MKKTVITVMLAAASLSSPVAHADHRRDCAQAEFAKHYTQELEATMKNNVERLRQQQAGHQKTLDAMKAALIQAGVWTQEDALLFFTNIWSSERGKAVADERIRMIERWKVQVRKTLTWNVSTPSQQKEMEQGMCLIGPELLAESTVFYDAMENVWRYMELTVADVAKEKNVALSQQR